MVKRRKAHQKLVARAFFDGKPFRNFFSAKQPDSGCFDVLLKRSVFVLSQHKNFDNAVGVVCHIMPAPVLNGYQPLRRYGAARFLAHLLFGV